MLHAACGADLQTKILVQGEFNLSLPRPSTLSRPPPSSSNPASCRRSSLHANRDCAVVWLVVAPASAHEHPDLKKSIAAPPLLLKKTREP